MAPATVSTTGLASRTVIAILVLFTPMTGLAGDTVATHSAGLALQFEPAGLARAAVVVALTPIALGGRSIAANALGSAMLLLLLLAVSWYLPGDSPETWPPAGGVTALVAFFACVVALVRLATAHWLLVVLPIVVVGPIGALLSATSLDAPGWLAVADGLMLAVMLGIPLNRLIARWLLAIKDSMEAKAERQRRKQLILRTKAQIRETWGLKGVEWTEDQLDRLAEDAVKRALNPPMSTRDSTRSWAPEPRAASSASSALTSRDSR